ncbi:hypothetical protein [Clostridium botulinum]|uniref:Uncharacterized protein n=1 Tax=Clostridium botulinum CFSAN001627 TaxID=1232189 RepID=M1ZZ58_CLOBO|nr:hypothetical protein [Clostridium botulinum]EKN42933.1 hypothetical protein CFSAN001627_03400 [Clostridium botulinum CFSAN001627]APC82195.1 hypothetical protein NPD12_3818 [Clostridium botulinum]AXG97790.1 hypothetical protein AGE31_19570 [Clostridium botulinum]MBY6773564.1 hypothetical protein [Clostridium botulinum]MBY6850406.1 hypothetical protein [Clostridium botulinum]
MEKAFIVSKESELFKDIEKYKKLRNKQRKFINKFFEENGIEANQYRVSGDGFCNVPFEKYEETITLCIIPTDKDKEKFSKVLNKPDERYLQAFRKTSKIAKDFRKQIVDEHIVINLYQPRMSDYFESIGFYGCGFTLFEHKNIMYLRVNSEFLKEDDIPKGLTEIRLSEFYKVREELEKSKGDK